MSMNKIIYPSIRKDDSLVEKLHGQDVPDPYRWLEDPDSEETQKFVEAQNAITMPYIDQCPVKDKINKRLTSMWDFPKYGCPHKKGSHYFYFHNSGLQNQSVMYMMDSLDSEPRVFLDPNKLSDDGTVALNGYTFTEDGAYFAYGLSSGGSDWITIKFINVATGENMSDVLEKVKFSSMSWTHDNRGMFYNCFPEQEGRTDGTETTTNLHHKLKYHVLGTSQSDDLLCMELPDHPKRMIGAEVSECGRYVIITVNEGCEPNNLLYFCDLQLVNNKVSGILPLEAIVDTFEAEFEYCTNIGTKFTFRTNLDAPLYKLITIDLTNFTRNNWTDLIPASEECLLEWATCINNDKLVVCHLKDVKNVLACHDAATGDKKFDLPIGLGSIDAFAGRKKDTTAFIRFVSFLTPGVIYSYDFSEDNAVMKVFREIKVANFDPTQFEVSQVFYSSKDGTKIPMFIVKPKSVILDGNNPCLLYGYGGFNITITPGFSVSRLLMMQHFKGIYTIANIRGGGEYGKKWHDGGRNFTKQNCFDDFQCAAEFLIQNKYTTNKKLIIQGGSNGGLLMGACINQRPDLFGASICQVGVLDMLRFHKFTIGHAWTSDFGNPDTLEDFNYIMKYSPLHNISTSRGPYPAVLLLTADHDDRVVPLHSFKFIAKLQEIVGSQLDTQTNPLLIRVDVKAGHGAGKPTAKSIQELTDIYSFLQVSLGLQWYD